MAVVRVLVGLGLVFVMMVALELTVRLGLVAQAVAATDFVEVLPVRTVELVLTVQ